MWRGTAGWQVAKGHRFRNRNNSKTVGQMSIGTPVISVVLCTHNPRKDYFERTLSGLRAQTLPLDRWELIIVDNASTSPIAEEWDISWHPMGRHVRERNVGLTAARIRGIDEALGSLLVFVDDDNVLSEGYLDEAYRTAERYTNLGVFGAGALVPEYETPPQRHVESRTGLLALRTVPRMVWSNNIDDWKSIPWGAGLCVRKEIARKFISFVKRLNATGALGRRGVHLFSGEDDIFSRVAVEEGMGFGLFPELRLTHLIASKRVSECYLLRLIHDHAFSHAVIDRVLDGRIVDPIRWTEYMRYLLHGITKGFFSMRCQMAAAQGRQHAMRALNAQEG